MAHRDAWEGTWRGNWRMEWVASTLHTTSEHGVSSITTADAHTSAASSRLNWRPRRFKWARPFRRKTKSGFWACTITFQLATTHSLLHRRVRVKEKRSILLTILRKKASWIGHTLRRNCHLKHVTEGKIKGKIEVTGRRGRRRNQLLDDLKRMRGCWALKEAALGRTLRRSHFGRCQGPVVKTDRTLNERVIRSVE